MLLVPSNVKQLKAFWSKVDLSNLEGCWPWIAATDKDGYGVYRRGRAHRVAWFLHYGLLPNLCVLHKCDNPPCIRWDHLFSGTTADNNRDMAEKGKRGRSCRICRRARQKRYRNSC